MKRISVGKASKQQVKKGKNTSAGKRESAKNSFDKSEAVFEEDIFDDDFDFTNNTNDSRIHKPVNKKAPIDAPPLFDYDEIDDALEEEDEIEEDDQAEQFEEKYFKKRSIHEKVYDQPGSLKNLNNIESTGNSLMFAFSTILLMGMGLPVVLVFYFNSPPLDQHFFVMGVSYFKILFIFFITSAVMVYTSLFFLKSRQFTIISVFLLSLFCCFPFIAGIRNDLTVMEAILDLKLFFNWPFFLKPAYLFFQLLLPFGILIYIFLQVKNITGKEKHSYAYICIAFYLGIAAFIGFALLNRTGQPNIISYIAPRVGNMGLFDTNNTAGDAAISSPLPIDATVTSRQLAVAEPVTSQNVVADAISQPVMAEPVVDKSARSDSTKAQPLPQAEPSPTSAQTQQSVQAAPALEPDFQELRARSSHLLDLISKIETILEAEYKGIVSSRVKPEVIQVQEHSAPEEEKPKNREVNLEEVERELQEVSTKLDMIWQAVAREKALNREK